MMMSASRSTSSQAYSEDLFFAWASRAAGTQQTDRQNNTVGQYRKKPKI